MYHDNINDYNVTNHRMEWNIPEKNDYIINEGSLEVKLPTVWTDGKAEVGRVREERKIREEKESRETVRRNKMQVHEKVEKSRFTVFFQWRVEK